MGFMLHPLRMLRALHARPRLMVSLCVGMLVYAAARWAFPLQEKAALALVGWNAGALLYLALSWQMMRQADAEGIRGRALGQDEGRWAILALVVAAAAAVLVAVATQIVRSRDMQGGERAAHLALAGITLASSWLFTQVLFALHYAHDFYAARIRGRQDPLLFPGTKDPLYLDFFHFACVIGCAAQTADISFNGSALRPAGTLHCVEAFVFNAALLALSLNVAAGQFG